MTLALAILATCGLWFWAGMAVCRFTHRHRGLEVDTWDIVIVPDDDLPLGLRAPEPADAR
jgi:hypothetical protein